MQRQPAGGSGVVYRRDVDGMRAVAVVLVVLGHLGLYFNGGFIGVDVFFVISGYLISAAILSEMDRGVFSIAGFYERRIRRIFPAMLATLAATAYLAMRYFLPSEVEAYGKSMLAALFSVSNLLFWKQAGYFDAESLTKPLLHTWSLAVEEQFYIFFPIFLVVVFRFFRRRIQPAIWVVWVVSLVSALLVMRHDTTAAFFLAPLRAWELLIGTIVSQKYLPTITGKAGRNIASAAGLLCIVVPAILYTDHTAFPGLAAVPPCVGAALIIMAGETGTSAVGWLLGLRPVVFVGLISYSLYLWHWPILVFQKTSTFLPRPFGNRLTVLVASMIVAYLSWKFIETPFRKGRFRPGRRMLFAQAGVAVAAVAAAGIAMAALHGFPQRLGPEAAAVAKYLDYNPDPAFRKGTCFMLSPEPFSDFKPATCLAEVPGKKNYLLFGDSKAADLYAGLAQVFPEINVMQATQSGCRALLHEPADADEPCKQMSQYMFHEWLPTHKVDAVMLSGFWHPEALEELGVTIKYLQGLGTRVIVFGPGIEYDAAMARIVAISLRDHDPSEIEKHRMPASEELDRKMAALARDQWKVSYISAYDDLCTPECVAYGAPGVPLMFDKHYTAEGATVLAKVIRAKGQLP